MSEQPKFPNPGSLDAVLAGCTCAVYDNQFGRGYRWTPTTTVPVYLMDEGCPLHGLREVEALP